MLFYDVYVQIEAVYFQSKMIHKCFVLLILN